MQRAPLTALNPQDEVRSVLVRRLEGIKKRDPQVIAGLVDKNRYTKFDDWPPLDRRGSEALNIEADALKVLKEYDYETSDLRIDMLGNVALATFTITYWGTIREHHFNVKSRVSVLLVNDGGWWIVHEHWSRFPLEQMHRRGFFRRL
jgi:hypothetical protein